MSRANRNVCPRQVPKPTDHLERSRGCPEPLQPSTLLISAALWHGLKGETRQQGWGTCGRLCSVGFPGVPELLLAQRPFLQCSKGESRGLGFSWSFFKGKPFPQSSVSSQECEEWPWKA